MATLALTDSPEQTAQTREFITAAAGPEAASAFNIGQEDEILTQVEELIDAGVDTFIFNMPMSGADDVRRAGELLVNRFG